MNYAVYADESGVPGTLVLQAPAPLVVSNPGIQEGALVGRLAPGFYWIAVKGSPPTIALREGGTLPVKLCHHNNLDYTVWPNVFGAATCSTSLPIHAYLTGWRNP